MAVAKDGNVKWVDGLRGLASLMVVTTHLFRAFGSFAFAPTQGDHQPPSFLQWPFVRVFIQGRIGVAYFAFVTGYVCALKPIRLATQDHNPDPQGALAAISKSALRRVPRLMLPTCCALVLSFAIAEVSGFEISRHADSVWMRTSFHGERVPLGPALNRLVMSMVRTWTQAFNDYDPFHWTLRPLLMSSMVTYVFVVATVYVRQRYRMLLALGLWVYYYLANDAAWGMQFTWGILLADLSNNALCTSFIATHATLRRILFPLLLIPGLFIASLPEMYYEWLDWSDLLQKSLSAITPAGADLHRYSSGLGLELITLALMFAPSARDVLSNRAFLWLGRHSFAVYLLHGPLMRSVLCWMVYGIWVPAVTDAAEGEETNQLKYPGHAALVMILPAWFGVLYGCAMLWMAYVDPWCARVTERLVAHVRVPREEKAELLPLAS